MVNQEGSSRDAAASNHKRLRSPPGNENASAQVEPRKRQRYNTALPKEMELVTKRWKVGNEVRSSSSEPTPSGNRSDPVPVWELNDGGQFVTVRLMNRARVLYENDKRCKRPGIDRPNTYSYYVGFDSWEMRPAFFDATRTTYNSNIADQTDSYENGGFKQASSESRARCIVPPCDILRTGALSHIKARRHVGRESGGTEATACEKFLERQNQALKAGRPCPVLVEHPDLPTDYAVLEKMKPDNWMYFRMMMPKIGRLNVPKELGEAIFQFQSKKKYCLDLLSLNLAISMCIVWHRYTTDPHHGAELEAFNNNNPNAGLEKKVTVPPLASFLLYAPHFFRFHEYYGLSAYMHIFRYVQHMHSRDVKLSAQFRINRKGIDESLVKRVVSQMNLQHDDWIEIVPPSWHGSRLTMPANHGPRALQSDETTAALLLDDINTLGFYNYTNADSYSFPRGHESHGKVWTTRDLQIHVDWVPQHVCSVAAWRYLDETPTSPNKNFGSLVYVNGTSYLPHGALDAWNENFKITHLWTAPKTAVRRPWKDCVKIASWEGQTSNVSSDGESFDGLAEGEHRSDGVEETNMIPVGQQDSRADEPAGELHGDEEPGMDEHEHEQLGGEETESGHSDGQQNAVSSAVRNIKDVDEIGDIVLEGHENPRRRRSDRTIQPAAVRDATAQTDLISDKDRRILRRLLMEDLADDKHIPPLLRLLRYVDVDDASLSNVSVISNINLGLVPIDKEVQKIKEYGEGIKLEGSGLSGQVIKPCCFLLGITWPEDDLAALDEIGKLDQPLVNSIHELSAIYALSPVNSERLADAVVRLRSSKSLLYVLRFHFFKDRLEGTDYGVGERELRWTELFGKPYADE